MKIQVCPVCGEPAHASETDDLNRHAECQVATPSSGQIAEWLWNSGCEAADGCWVEPDGTCEHGSKSWALILGVV